MEEVRGHRCVLLKFGELALKGRNRPLFVNALERNLRRLTSDLGTLEIRHRGGVLIVTSPPDEDQLVERSLALPGGSVVQRAIRCERDPAAMPDLERPQVGGEPAQVPLQRVHEQRPVAALQRELAELEQHAALSAKLLHMA